MSSEMPSVNGIFAHKNVVFNILYKYNINLFAFEPSQRVEPVFLLHDAVKYDAIQLRFQNVVRSVEDPSQQFTVSVKK